MPVIDLKFKLPLGYPPGILQEELAHVHRQTHFFTGDGLHAHTYL
jgi:hypothetical protein